MEIAIEAKAQETTTTQHLDGKTKIVETAKDSLIYTEQ